MKQLLQVVLTAFLAFAPLQAFAHDVEEDSIFYNLDKAAKTAAVTYYGNNNSSAKYSGSVSIPEEILVGDNLYTVTSIGSYAFYKCKDLTFVILPASLQTVDKQAFFGCTGLKYVKTASMDNFRKVKFADEYSNPTRYTGGKIEQAEFEVVDTVVRFTAPEIKRDEPTPSTSTEQEPEEDLVNYVDMPYFVKNGLKSTGMVAADRYISELIFGEASDNLQQAYDKFKQLWKKQGVDGKGKSSSRRISFYAFREYTSRDKRFACFHVTASLSGSRGITRAPDTPEGRKMTKQYLTLVNGIDRYFIFDMDKQQVAGMDEVFQPSVAAKLKRMFGNEVSMYAEDRCLQLMSSKGEGRFIFSPVNEKNFTDYFKQLVGWNSMNYDTPEYLHGQSALWLFLREQKIYQARGDEEYDNVEVVLTINEDGTVADTKVIGATIYCSEERLQAACSKMPKWKPAYKDGVPTTKQARFTVRVPRWIGEPEVQAEFPNGGTDALMKFINENMKYPAEAEKQAIQGRVICQFIVETDGTISNLKVVKHVHPLLDAEAIRVLSLMPTWKPGLEKGTPVRVKLNIPFTFRLR